MKVSKRTNRICLGLAIAALVAIFFYQVVYATNESSYKFGRWAGFGDYDCHNNPHNPNTGDCDDANSGIVNTICVSELQGHVSTQLTNSTACIDGYVNGFVQWCSQDKSDCAMEIKEGHAPLPDTNYTGVMNNSPVAATKGVK